MYRARASINWNDHLSSFTLDFMFEILDLKKKNLYDLFELIEGFWKYLVKRSFRAHGNFLAASYLDSHK